LNVAAACSFSEWHSTIEASTSITSPGQLDPSGGRHRDRRAGDLSPLRQRHLPGRRRRRGDASQPPVAELSQQPPHSRVRRHRAEQARLIALHSDVGDALRAVGHRDREIHQHPPRIMHRPRQAQTRQHGRQLGDQRRPVGQVSQQP